MNSGNIIGKYIAFIVSFAVVISSWFRSPAVRIVPQSQASRGSACCR